MKIGRNIPKTYMDRHFDTDRLFNHSRPRTPKVVLPKKKEEAKPKAVEIDVSPSLRNTNPRFEGEYKTRLEGYKKRKGIRKDAKLKKDDQIEFTKEWFKYLLR